MSLFLKHECQAKNGQIEAVLYVNKAQLPEKDDVTKDIKHEAVHYIKTECDTIPIRVVRIMIGSMLYFSFAVNSNKELSPLV